MRGLESRHLQVRCKLQEGQIMTDRWSEAGAHAMRPPPLEKQLIWKDETVSAVPDMVM